MAARRELRGGNHCFSSGIQSAEPFGWHEETIKLGGAVFHCGRCTTIQQLTTASEGQRCCVVRFPVHEALVVAGAPAATLCLSEPRDSIYVRNAPLGPLLRKGPRCGKARRGYFRAATFAGGWIRGRPSPETKSEAPDSSIESPEPPRQNPAIS